MNAKTAAPKAHLIPVKNAEVLIFKESERCGYLEDWHLSPWQKGGSGKSENQIFLIKF